jgi:hypothetical protein
LLLQEGAAISAPLLTKLSKDRPHHGD